MKIFTRAVVGLGLLASLPTSAWSAPSIDRLSPRQGADQLQQQVGGQLDIEWDRETGVPNFVMGDLPIDAVAASAAQSPERLARVALDQYAGLFSLRDQATDLALAGVDRDETGLQHIRFDQTVNGVPVFGGQLVVHLRDGRVTAINGKYFPDLQVDASPRLAQAAALTTVQNDVGDDTAEFRAVHSGLVIYVDGAQPHLAWKVNVFSWKNLGNWLYFVDAHDGQVIHKLNQLDTAAPITVYTANHGTSLPGSSVCGTGTGDASCTVTGDLDARSAFTNTAKVYNYYKNVVNRLSYDGLDSELRSTIRYRSNYYNAFWNGVQMVYGDGDTFAQAFDVIAHELTHGVTQETDQLIYEHQSGALNESWSDVMAVFAGCSPATGAANCNWSMGETLGGGAIRDLSNPPAFGDPDHFSDYLWLPLEADNGGVHTNSGIPNKAAYLTTSGGTFHSVVVSGLGYTKTEQIYYGAMSHYLTTYSDFFSARMGLYAACRDKIGTYGITSANCNQVLNAWAAVGVGSPAPLTTPGPRKVYLPLMVNNYPPVTCLPSQILSNGSFESGAQSWVESTLLPGSSLVTNQLPNGFNAHDGSWLAWLGGYPNANDILYQTVAIPNGRTALQADFYLYVASQDVGSTPYDLFYVSLQPVNSMTSPEVWYFDNTFSGYGWWHAALTFNELPYAGQSLRLYFHATTDSSLNTNFFLDTTDLHVQCTRYTPQLQSTRQPITVQIERVYDRPAPDPLLVNRAKK